MKLIGTRDQHYWFVKHAPALVDRYSIPLEIQMRTNIGILGVVYTKDGRWLAL